MKNNISKNCSQFSNDIWYYIDGSLSIEKKELLKEHLASCSTCSAELKTAQDSIRLYETLPLEDIDEKTYKTIVRNVTAKFASPNSSLSQFSTSGRSLSEMFGFYKLAFGGGLLAAALLLIFITFFNNTKLPEIETKISEELLAWDFPGFNTEPATGQNQIVKLKTEDWDITIVRKNSTENWGSALRAIQKQIRKMQTEVVSTSM